MIHTTKHAKIKKSCISQTTIIERLQLPIAPTENHRTRFASIDTSANKALHPGEAARLLQAHIDRGEEITRVCLAGLGDTLASYDHTVQTIKLIRSQYPQITLSIQTLGINGEKYADQLAGLGVTHVELLLNSIDLQHLEKFYAWIRPGVKTTPLPEAIKILHEEQEKAVRAFKDAGMHITVIMTIFPEDNIRYIEKMAKVLAKRGVDSMCLIPISTTKAHETSGLSNKTIYKSIYSSCCAQIAKHLPVQKFVNPYDFETMMTLVNTTTPKPTTKKPNAALVTTDSISVNLHLGHAKQIHIYGPQENGIIGLLEIRTAPTADSGAKRWEQLGDMLSDCFVFLAANAGDSPRAVLEEYNLPLILTEEPINDLIEMLYEPTGNNNTCLKKIPAADLNPDRGGQSCSI